MNVATSNSYFHGHKGNFQETFCHQKWDNSVKRGKEKDDKNEKQYDNKDYLGHTCLTSKPPKE